MNVGHRELLILSAVFVGVVVFVWKFIVTDLPDDFLRKARSKVQPSKEGDDGRLCDHW